MSDENLSTSLSRILVNAHTCIIVKNNKKNPVYYKNYYTFIFRILKGLNVKTRARISELDKNLKTFKTKMKI